MFFNLMVLVTEKKFFLKGLITENCIVLKFIEVLTHFVQLISLIKPYWSLFIFVI